MVRFPCVQQDFIHLKFAPQIPRRAQQGSAMEKTEASRDCSVHSA